MVSILPHAAASLLSLTSIHTTALENGGHKDGAGWGKDITLEVAPTDLALGDNLGVHEQGFYSAIFSEMLDLGGVYDRGDGDKIFGCQINMAPQKVDTSFIQTPEITVDLLRDKFFSAVHEIPAEAPAQTADAAVALPSIGPKL